MTQRRRIQLDGLADQILIHLHQIFFDDTATYVRFADIRAAIAGQPANAIRLELDSLIDDGFIDQKTERRFRPTSTLGLGAVTTPTYWEEVDGYRLSKKGINRVEEIDDERYQKLQDILSYEPVSNRTAGQGPSETNSEEWEPLPIDRDDPKLNEAISKTEEALNAFEQENGFAEKEPDVKAGMVETIRGNLAALKNGFPSKMSIIEGLLKPLKAVAKIFGTNFVGVAAQAAVKAIAAYFGIPL